jgi:hypothetical protein
MIKLGDIVKDKLSDFTGTVVARAEYLYGCVWLNVIPQELNEGKTVEDVWFDEARLECVITALRGWLPGNPPPEEVAYHKGSPNGPVPSRPKRNFPKPGKG